MLAVGGAMILAGVRAARFPFVVPRGRKPRRAPGHLANNRVWHPRLGQRLAVRKNSVEAVGGGTVGKASAQDLLL